MDELLKRFEPRTLSLMMVATTIVLATALASYAVWPRVKDYRQSLNTLMVLERVAGNGDTLNQEMATLRGEVDTLNQKLHGDMLNLPEKQVESFIIGRLQGISWRNNVELTSVKPGKGGKVQAFEEILFNVNVSGNYFDLYAWLHDLGDELGFVVVKNFNIRVKDKATIDPRLTASMTIVSYREAESA